jgi:hypothetical protein
MSAPSTTARRPDGRLVMVLLIASGTVLLLGPFDLLHSGTAQWASLALALGVSAVAVSWTLRSGVLRHRQSFNAEAADAFLSCSASFPIGVKAAPGYSSFGGWNFWPSMRLWINGDGVRISVNPHYLFAATAQTYGLVATYAIAWDEIADIVRRKRSIEIGLKGNPVPVTISRPTAAATQVLEELLRTTWHAGGTV